MRVVRVGLGDFELEDGSIHPLTPPLVKEIPLDAFQTIFDGASLIIESLKNTRSDSKNPSNLGKGRKD